jgi:choline-sulfatase
VTRASGAAVLAVAVTACFNPRVPPEPVAAAPPSAHAASGPDRPPAAASVMQPEPEGVLAPAPVAREQRQRPDAPLSVLLIVLDGVRADVPWHGYARPIAPLLTSLSKRSVDFTRAYSVSSYTAKSISALLSGQYPSSQRRSGHFFTLFPASNRFFPELLQEAGVHTLSVQVGTYLRPGTGLDQGFAIWAIPEGIPPDPRSNQYITSDKLTLKAIELLQSSPPDQLKFMYLHYMDPHEPYLEHDIAPKWGHSARDRYDQEVWFTDYWVGELLTFCRQQPWWDRTAIIVTADHGEAFGEHGRYKHGFALYEMVVRVPLLFHVPGAPPGSVATRRSHIDVGPTILDLMGQPIPADLVGKSLVPEIFGAPALPRPILLDLPADTNNPEARALIDGAFKLIVNGEDYNFELYDLSADPDELHNLAASHPDELARMQAQYRRLWQQVPVVKAYGGMQLSNGRIADGPM